MKPTAVFGGARRLLGLGLVVLDLPGHGVGLVGVRVQLGAGVLGGRQLGGFGGRRTALGAGVVPLPPRQARDGPGSQRLALWRGGGGKRTDLEITHIFLIFLIFFNTAFISYCLKPLW